MNIAISKAIVAVITLFFIFGCSGKSVQPPSEGVYIEEDFIGSEEGKYTVVNYRLVPNGIELVIENKSHVDMYSMVVAVGLSEANPNEAQNMVRLLRKGGLAKVGFPLLRGERGQLLVTIYFYTDRDLRNIAEERVILSIGKRD